MLTGLKHLLLAAATTRKRRKRKVKLGTGNPYRCPYCKMPVGNLKGHIEQTPQCRRKARRREHPSGE